MVSTKCVILQVSGLHGDMKLLGADVQSVHHVVRSLETKIHIIEGRLNETNFGVGQLVDFVRNLEHRSLQRIEGATSNSSRSALELPEVSPSRAIYLPVNPLLESPSTSNGSQKRQATFQPPNYPRINPSSASCLKELDGLSNNVGMSTPSDP